MVSEALGDPGRGIAQLPPSDGRPPSAHATLSNSMDALTGLMSTSSIPASAAPLMISSRP